MATLAPDVTQEVFITGLKNVHAVEHQALALMDRQLDHLANYPEAIEMLRQHRAETEQQIERVDRILEEFGTSASGIKDLGLSLSGNAAAIVHTFAPDEILKNSFANHAFENFEAASYASLLTLVDLGGYSAAKEPLQQSLDEEVRMAKWVWDALPRITQQYVALRSAGETASH
jgi:ferritin-like metal-binding protein YciE